MLFFERTKVNLFELYLANRKETIVIKFLDQTADELLLCINNDEVRLPRRNFSIDRLVSRFNLCKIAMLETGACPKHNLMVEVVDRIIKMSHSTLDKLMARVATNSSIKLDDYPDRWRLFDLVFTNADNSIVMYYTGSVMESSPARYGFVKNCEKTKVTNGGFHDSDYWSIDWYIDAYKLHPVHDDAECQRLRQLAKSLPPLPELSAEDRAKVVESSPSWHKCYYSKFDADDEEAVAEYQEKEADSDNTVTRQDSSRMEVSDPVVIGAEADYTDLGEA